MIIRRIAILCALTPVFLSACNNREEVKQGDYFSVHAEVTGEEGNPRANILIHINNAGSVTEGLKDSTGWSVLLDQQPMATLVTPAGEILYELQAEAESFSGWHSFRISGPEKAALHDSIGFHPISLAEELPQSVSSEGFAIKLNTGGSDEGVRLILADTGFQTRDFHEEVELNNGELMVTAQMLQALKPGPLNIEIYRLHRKRLASASRINGNLEERYTLRRNTSLVK